MDVEAKSFFILGLKNVDYRLQYAVFVYIYDCIVCGDDNAVFYV